MGLGLNQKNILYVIIAALAIGLFSFSPEDAFAADRFWDGEGTVTPGVGGNTFQQWSDPLNWDGDTLPTGADNISFLTSCPTIINFDVAPFTLSAASTLTVASGCDVQSVDIINQGTISISGRLRPAGNFDNQNQMTVNSGGSAAFIGLNGQNSGQLTIAGSITIPAVNGKLTNTASGTITNNNQITFGGSNSVLLNQGDIDGTGNIGNTGTIQEDCGSTIAGTQTITGTARVNVCVNTIPVANDDASPTTDEDIAFPITLTGLDADGDALTFSIVLSPTDGSLGTIGAVTCGSPTVNDCKADVTYTPDANFNGADSFTFKVNDGTVDSAAPAAIVDVTVNPVNDPPTITPIADPAAILEDAVQQTINFAGITEGPANESAQTTSVGVVSSDPTLTGALTLNYVIDAANGSIQYTPVGDANGVATITVTVTDSGTGTNSVQDTFDVTVTAVNDEPTLDAITDPAAILEDAVEQTVNLAGISEGPANESGQTLTITATSNRNLHRR